MGGEQGMAMMMPRAVTIFWMLVECLSVGRVATVPASSKVIKSHQRGGLYS
jgi:hypothetical protein